MRQVAGQTGVYRFETIDRILGVQYRVLPDAVTPLVDGSPVPTLAIMAKGLKRPAGNGCYLVRVIDRDTVQPVAYLDEFGRAFAVEDVIVAPPARRPDLLFARFSDQDEQSGVQMGCVTVVQEGNEQRDVARYRSARDRYTLFDSWQVFEPYGEDMSYREALARAYAAFVVRPSLGAPQVPTRGIWFVLSQLSGDKPLSGMRTIVAQVRSFSADPAFCPPAIVSCLACWLEEEGLSRISNVEGDALRLVRTARYADTYYLSTVNDDAQVPRSVLWGLESALNRFLLVREALGDDVSIAEGDEVGIADARTFRLVATQHPKVGELATGSESHDEGGEWDVRCAIGSALERLRLPVRVEMALRADVAAGVVALDLTVPGLDLMPASAWREGPDADWVMVGDEERAAAAREYAAHVALLLVAVAFESSKRIQRVDVAAHPVAAAQPTEAASSNREVVDSPAAFFKATFDRATFEGMNAFEMARTGDPMPPFELVGAQFEVKDADADPFSFSATLPSATLRRDLPESDECNLSAFTASVLGTHDSADLRINYEAAARRTAERLADRIVDAGSASNAIRIVREAQSNVHGSLDERERASFTRLMAALAEGTVDMGDQNAVVGSFLGEDRCMKALARAKGQAQDNPEDAVKTLVDAIAESVALDGFIDGPATVYRSFDSYAGRVLYNRAIQGTGALSRRVASDARRHVELVPDSFYLCHLEIVRLLEHSFERADEALRYGQRTIEIAPTIAAGYRQLGRAYMLVGDMESSSKLLQEGLGIAVQPADIAMLYYQLAYVLWKLGRPYDGAVCYLKSVSVSPVVALQATAELQELVEETGVVVPGRDVTDEELEQAGLPVSPSPAVIDAMGAGAAAAVDAGLFPVARNLLSVRLRFRSDDALVNVLRSLDE